MKVLYSEVGGELNNKSIPREVLPKVRTDSRDASASLGRPPTKAVKKHQKSHSLGSDSSFHDKIGYFTEDEDNISDTDNEEEWEKEGELDKDYKYDSPSHKKHQYKEPASTFV